MIKGFEQRSIKKTGMTILDNGIKMDIEKSSPEKNIF